jgi:hypothetical protein
MSQTPLNQPSPPADAGPELDRLCLEVRPRILRLFKEEPVRQLWELEQQVPRPHALARFRLEGKNSPVSPWDQVAYGRSLLAGEVLDALVREGICVREGVNGEEEIRLLAPTHAAVPEAGTDAVDEARPAQDETNHPPALDGGNDTVDNPAATAPAGVAAPTESIPAGAEDSPELPFHELANLFPLLTGPAFDEFVEDIRVNGLLDPIWLLGGKVLDGRNRYRACRALGINPPIREYDGNGPPLAFVLSQNLHRRHLSASQLALIGAKVKPLLAEEARQRMLAGRAADPGAKLPQGKARDQAAAAVGVSPRSIDAASKVLNEGSEELIDAVAAGEVSASVAADLAELPPDEQAEAVKGGKQAVMAKASAVRQKKSQDRQHRGQGRRERTAAAVAPTAQRPDADAQASEPLTE